MNAAAWVYRAILIVLLQSVDCTAALAIADIFVSDSNTISRLNDINGDGDALDSGENVLWSDQIAAPTSLAQLGKGVLVRDAANGGSLYLLRDSNGDGDALDSGEAIPWFSNSGGVRLTDIDSDGSTVYASGGIFGDSLFRLHDLNKDGDAEDTGEFQLYASVFAADMSVHGSRLLIGDAATGGVFSIFDKNGDGDALDIGESVLHSSADFGFVSRIAQRTSDSYFMSNPFTNSVFQATDRNGDGDALDVAEVLTFAEPSPEGITLLGAIASGPDGSLFADGFQAAETALFRFLDLNGDGDALDAAEVQRFANTFGIADMLLICFPGDFDCDSDVDGFDFLTWQTDPSVGSLTDWKNNYSSPAPLAVNAEHIPEPATLILALFGLFVSTRRRRPHVSATKSKALSAHRLAAAGVRLRQISN